MHMRYKIKLIPKKKINVGIQQYRVNSAQISVYQVYPNNQGVYYVVKGVYTDSAYMEVVELGF